MKTATINIGDLVRKNNKQDLWLVTGFLGKNKVICRKTTHHKIFVDAYNLKELQVVLQAKEQF